MSGGRKPKEMARGERTLPGIWRLRLPLPWPGVPHGNAWAVAAGDGIVLFDTGYAGEDGTRQLENALEQVGFGLTDIRLVVCTHAHTDHYGLAGPIVDAAGCDVWLHPDFDHVRRLVEDPDGTFDHRIEIARQGGVPQVGLDMYEKRRGMGTGIVRIVEPAVDLLPGVVVETDVGPWQVYETPGHAPSHVVLHQADSGLLISGDHLLGRVSVFFDHGHTPDPVAEFLDGLDTVEALDTKLCLPGHGRPFRQIPGKVGATRLEVEEQRERVLESIIGGPKTAFETVPDLIGRENMNPGTSGWGLQLAFAYLDNLTLSGDVEPIPDADPRRWKAAGDTHPVRASDSGSRGLVSSAAMTGGTEQIDQALADARWNLDPLVDGKGADGCLALLDEASAGAREFAECHRGKVSELDADALLGAMRQLEELFELVGRAGSYASLWFTVDTADPERGALLQQVQELGAEIETSLLFFELEWNQVSDERAEELLADERLAFCAHHLRTARRYLPHQLTEPEERVLTEAEVTGSTAFRRLFTELTSALMVELPGAGEPVPLMEALSRLQDPDRERRAEAAAGVTSALEPGLRTRAFIFNTLLQDKSTKDRLRMYENWLAARNLANEASDESVAALIDAVTGSYELARRWYRLKARLLGLEKLAYYDRMAPVTGEEIRVPYAGAKELVLDCYRGFSPELGDAAAGFFDGDYIDAPPEPGKRGGAFCAYAVPAVHPYVMLNYTSRSGDVLTMAHELGHGVHAYLAREQGLFQFSTPLTVAETASIFGETIVLERLLDDAPDAAARLSLLAESLDGAVAAVFRQVAMNRFEDRIHLHRRESGELSVETLGELWQTTQADLLGDSVEPDDAYASWWSYVPHFVDTPGYVYAYAYGHLLALSVYRRYQEVGAEFVPSYLDLLKAGGSRSPEDLGQIVGVDLTDPGFWQSGLDLIAAQLDAAEAAASEAGRI